MQRALLIALLALIHGAPPAAAQWNHLSATDTTAVVRVGVAARDAPGPGTRAAYSLRGTMQRIAPDTLYLRVPGDSVVAVPRIRILRVEESLGVSRRESARMLGYGFSLVAGLALLAADDLGVEIGWLRGGTIVAAAGLTGAVAGALLPWERWEPAWLPEGNAR